LATTEVFVFVEEEEEEEVEVEEEFKTEAISSTVGPKALGYCSVTTMARRPNACAPLTSLELVSATASKPAIRGLKRSWTSQTKRAVVAGSRLPSEEVADGDDDAIALIERVLRLLVSG
jgi:hypothetical protein